MITYDDDGTLQLKPLIQAIFEQLYGQGIRKFYVVVGRGKRAIEDHFSLDSGLLESLQRKGSPTKGIERFYEKIRTSNLMFLNQPEPRGFGDAVLLGQPVIRGTFLVQAADTYILSEGDRYLGLMAEMHRRYGAAATILWRDVEDPRQYGVLEGATLEDGVIEVTSAVEKPKVPRSRHAIMPIYLFTDRIFESLSSIEPGVGREIQLTDAIRDLIDSGETVIGVRLGDDEMALDIGSPETMVESLRLALGYVDDRAKHGARRTEPPLVTATARPAGGATSSRRRVDSAPT